MSKRKIGSLLLVSPIIVSILIFIFFVVLHFLFPQFQIMNPFVLWASLLLIVLSILVGLPLGIIKILNSDSKGTFSIGDINHFSRDQTKKNFWMFFRFMMTYVLVQIVISYFLDDKTNSQIVLLISNTVSLIIGIIFMIGFTNISLIVTDKQKLKYMALFDKIKYFFHFGFAYAIYLLIFIGGTILFIIPGIYRAIRFSFYPYLVIEKGYNPIKALKESRRITNSKFRDIFSYMLLLGLINILGFLCLFVGLLWTVPMTKIAQAKMYKALSE